MLFNSALFLYVFLPVVVLGYYAGRARGGYAVAEAWLFAASLLFYASWDVRYLPLLLGSIAVNYRLGQTLRRQPRRRWLAVGVALNLGLLGFYKYADFFLGEVNALAGTAYPLIGVILPLGLSFITFQQIAYLVDSYHGQSHGDEGWLRYALFVTFFPQLVAGPIVQHREIIPQFGALARPTPGLPWGFATGLFIFSVGLFKKVVIADSLAPWADRAFADATALGFFDAWTAALAYTLQIYFDFSAYSDMAVGLGLLFGLRLPLNFLSPYQAVTISDFWRRWHITLGRFLRDYLYIPLGGNRQRLARTLMALAVTMLLGGLWHGAAWTFVAWGGLHGAYLAVYHLWRRGRWRLPRPVAWALTFTAVVFAWVLFRADSFAAAWHLWGAMLGLHGVDLPNTLRPMLGFLGEAVVWSMPRQANGLEMLILLPLLVFVVTQPNVHDLAARFQPTRRWGVTTFGAAAAAVVLLGQPTTFIYWAF